MKKESTSILCIRSPRFLYLLLVCGYMIALFYLSSCPGERLVFVEEDAVKRITILNILHAPIYAGLTVLWLLLLFGGIRAISRSWVPYVIAALVCMVYGIFNEWYQSFVPDRSLSPEDVMFNCIGVLFAVAAVRILAMRQRCS